jgi:hypothetical protein
MGYDEERKIRHNLDEIRHEERRREEREQEEAEQRHADQRAKGLQRQRIAEEEEYWASQRNEQEEPERQGPEAFPIEIQPDGSASI